MTHRARVLDCTAILLLALGLLFPVAATASGPASGPGLAAPAAAALEPQVDLTLKAPYVIFPGDATQMKVLWQLTATATSTIDWGTDTDYALGSAQTTEYGIDHQHTYTITDLVPGTKYYYRVTVEGVAHSGSFVAAPPADASQLKFFAYGDTRTNATIHDQVAAAMNAAYAADPAYQSFTLFVGDEVTSGGTESYWTSEFFNPIYGGIEQLIANLPFQACMGNHEGTGVLFMKYFPYPFVGSRYWSFDYGPAHFAILDQYTDFSRYSEQYRWLVADLENAKKPWKFVLLHEPGWSAGGGHPNNTTVQTDLEPVFELYEVPIVFGGHNHYYARAVVRGVQHITTGGGGAPLYSPDVNYPNVVTATAAYHFCQIAIAGGDLSFKAVNLAGAVIDSFSLHRSTAVEGGAPAGASLGAAQPNPTAAETVIQYRLGEGAHGRLVIRDVAGRVVRTFRDLAAGAHSLRWDGRDDAGRPLHSGLYFYRLEWDSGARGGKLLLLR